MKLLVVDDDRYAREGILTCLPLADLGIHHIPIRELQHILLQNHAIIMGCEMEKLDEGRATMNG